MADDDGVGQGDWLTRGRAATAALAETWASLAEICHDLVTQEWALPTECPGWDVQDQISHLIGIERMIMGEDTPVWDGPLGDHVKNDFAALNEKWIAVRRAEPGPAVQAEFVEVTRARLAQLEAKTAEEWAVVGFSPVGDTQYAHFMETRVFDTWVHEQDVRLALDRPGGSGGLASSSGIGQVEAAMGFVVGKKAAAPEGSVVHFEISGPADDARSFSIGVEGGRARPVAGGDPSVTLSMSSIDFVRLGCGRSTGADLEAAGRIGVAGDAALGRQILGVMNFMF
jgi:uncharacterized protein (TIGR03083 family)